MAVRGSKGADMATALPHERAGAHRRRRRLPAVAQVRPGAADHRPIEHSAASQNDLTAKLVVELRALPVRSTTATRLLMTLQDPRSGPSEVASVLETDPALAVRILHLANTPFYGLSRRVGSVQHAVSVLGFTTVRAIAAATAVGMLGDDAVGTTAAEDVWRHSLATASAAAVITRHVKLRAPEIFGAALLHDVGRSLFARIVPDELEQATALSAELEITTVEAEQSVFGMCHAEAGALALDELGLPQGLVQAVRRHHDAPAGSAAALIAAANEAAHWLDAGADRAAADPVLAALSHLGAPEAVQGTLLDEMQDSADEPGLLVALGR
jgi:putative nucleotidyltransferase with HDIG domain